jgi:hypothetical protein
MSNARTGMWSALGAILGGVAGAAAGKYAAQTRPRGRRDRQGEDLRGDVEDAMVVGGSAGAVLGAFVAGAAMGEQVQVPRLTNG